MPEWVIGKIAHALNERGQAIKGAQILVLGLAYKKNVEDVRESPAAQILELLRERGALLNYSDPHVPSFPKMREHSFDLKSLPLNAETLLKQDCVVLVTDHDAFDYETIAKHSKILVDTRGRYLRPAANIVKA